MECKRNLKNNANIPQMYVQPWKISEIVISFKLQRKVPAKINIFAGSCGEQNDRVENKKIVTEI